jgi:hypothetical protein
MINECCLQFIVGTGEQSTSGAGMAGSAVQPQSKGDVRKMVTRLR